MAEPPRRGPAAAGSPFSQMSVSELPTTAPPQTVPEPARPLRVLHLLNNASGGAALSTLGLMRALAARGVESYAVCEPSGTDAERAELAAAVAAPVSYQPLYWWNRKIRSPWWKRPLVELRQRWRTGGPTRSAARVAECATRWQVDLIHTNNLVTPEGGLAARALGLPHVWHLRELIGPGQPYRLPREGRRLGAYLAAHASVVVANSHAAAERVRDWLPPGLLEVVPNGIDLEPFTAERDGPTDRVVVGLVGHLASRSKRHALFLEAAARVPAEVPVEFRIYGQMDERSVAASTDEYIVSLRTQAARLSLTPRLRWMAAALPPAIMRQLDLLVHTSEGESFGRVAVEAMAAARPVVGARGGGIAEIVVDGVTGLLAQPGNAAEFAAHIARLARDAGLRQRLGAAGRDRALAEYALPRCADRILAVYRRAIQHPVAASRAR